MVRGICPGRNLSVGMCAGKNARIHFETPRLLYVGCIIISAVQERFAPKTSVIGSFSLLLRNRVPPPGE